MKKNHIITALTTTTLLLTACTSIDNSTPAPTPVPDTMQDEADDHAHDTAAPAPGNGTSQDKRIQTTPESTTDAQNNSNSGLDVRMELVSGLDADKTGQNRFSIKFLGKKDVRVFMPIWESFDEKGNLTGKSCTVDFEWLTLDGDLVASNGWADCTKKLSTTREYLEIHDSNYLPRKGTEETYLARLTVTSPDDETAVIEEEVLVRYPA